MNQTKRFLSRHSALPFVLGALPLLGLGCSASDKPIDAAQAQRGLSDAPDGDLTTSTPNLQVNAYAQLSVDAPVNATTVTVPAAQLMAMNLKAGDLVMIMQMQGAQISTTDDETYGTIMNTGGAGRFELIGVKAVNTTTGVITLDNLCMGLKNAYTVAGNTQVIRVPQYATLTLNTAASLVAANWNGSTGGVLALRARRVNITGSGVLDVRGAGFRGGAPSLPGSSAQDTPTFISTTGADGGGKGEGIAGYFPNRFGRGAVANGGGGGNSFGAGGGGGANAGSATGWKGNGVMSLINANDAMAWALDPEAIANANTRTNEGGGGRGGHSQAFTVQDESALTKGPGDSAWGGNLRRERGGRGGSPVANNPATQLFLGGGGGAGAPVDAVTAATPGSGGRGGGLIYVLAGRVEGDGYIWADGRTAPDLQAPMLDGVGGGGGGGTIVLNATTVAGSLKLDATGGGGGGQYDAAVPVLLLEAEGPGGGGGGGYIAVPQGTPASVMQDASGGTGGITESGILTEFPSNGATAGKAGLTGQALGATPICAPADLRVSVTDGATTDNQGTRLTYLVTVYNDGPFTAVAAPVTTTISPALTDIEWTCSAIGPDQDSSPATCAASQGNGNVAVAVTLPAGATASFLVRVPITSMTTGAVQFTATIGVPPDVNDIDMANNSDSDTTTIGPEADLRMRATVAPNMTRSGQPLTYVLSVNNGGPNPAENVVMTFDIPAGATVVGDPVGDGWNCSIADMLLTCLRQSLPRGAAPDVTLTIMPDPNAAFATGSARVSSDSADPDLSNNSATAVATIEYDPNGFSKVSLAGGGIGCSQASRSSAQPFALSIALLATALLLQRRRRARREH